MSTPERDLDVLVLSASARADSFNTRLAQLAREVLGGQGARAEYANIADFDVPMYDGDVESRDGLPPGAEALRERLEAVDALVIASPEYNFSMPGCLKNLIDWVSRYRPQPFQATNTLLLSASPSMAGGNRGLWALRVPLEHLGARVYPAMFSLSQAHRAFGDDGRLADDDLAARLTDTVSGFLDVVEADKHYPCMKRRWTEFLGEPVDAHGRPE